MGHTRDTHPHKEDTLEPLETLLRLAKTKADMAEVIGMLYRRNQKLQQVRDDLGTQLAQARLNNGGTR